jgi:hypothetical protein
MIHVGHEFASIEQWPPKELSRLRSSQRMAV